MSDIVVNVTNAGAANVAVTNGTTVNATVGNGGAVNVAVGGISPGNATVVSGTLTINSTTTLAAGTPAYAKNVGTVYAAKLDLGIPAGPATNVTVGNTTTLSPGLNATVSGVANGNTLTLAFGIPAGQNGTTPTIQIGNVTTGAAGSSACVTATPANGGQLVTLDLTIPRGDPGSNGSNGTNLTLSDATPSSLGTAGAGTSTLVSRADHVHALPVIAYGNLSGVPSNFPTNTTLVSGLSSSYATINHSHNYVTSLNNLTGSLTLAAGSNVTLTANGSTLTLASTGGLGGNDAIDGGEYVGEIVQSITFLTQPQSVTANSTTTLNVSAVNATGLTAPLGLAAYGSLLFTSQTAYNSSTASWTAALRQSSDNGTTWSASATLVQTDITSSQAPLSQIASNGTRAVFAAATSLFYSDSATISAATKVAGLRCQSVAWNGTRWVASEQYTEEIAGIVYYRRRLHSSSDGANWTQRFSNYQYDNYGQDGDLPVVAAGGKFVLLRTDYNGSQLTDVVMTSADGINWTTSNRAWPAAAVASSGSRIVAVSGTGARHTVDGTTWLSATLPVACNRITYAAGVFMAFNGSQAGTDVCYSIDGSSWSLGSLPSSSRWQAAAAYSSTAFAAGTSPTSYASVVVGQTTASANLTVSATAASGSPVSYQWQSSLDAGTSWSNVANATSTTLSLVNLTQSDNGTRYRALATATGSPPAYSQSALLTVTG